MESINMGRPLVQTDPTSKITTEIKRIAELIGDGNHATLAQPRKKLLRSMFGRQTPSTVMELSTLPDTP
jgi:Flp pilus assembly CpaE family ATPase